MIAEKTMVPLDFDDSSFDFVLEREEDFTGHCQRLKASEENHGIRRLVFNDGEIEEGQWFKGGVYFFRQIKPDGTYIEDWAQNEDSD